MAERRYQISDTRDDQEIKKEQPSSQENKINSNTISDIAVGGKKNKKCPHCKKVFPFPSHLTKHIKQASLLLGLLSTTFIVIFSLRFISTSKSTNLSPVLSVIKSSVRRDIWTVISRSFTRESRITVIPVPTAGRSSLRGDQR